MSGVDVVIGTPPSLLRILERNILDIKELRHMVSAGVEELICPLKNICVGS